MNEGDGSAGTAAVDDDVPAGLPETSLTRLPLAAVLAAADSRLHAGLLGDYLDVLASAADSGRRLTRAELQAFRDLGQAAAESGASLRALVDLYLSATWRVWPSLPAVREADRTARELTRASSEPVAPGQLADALRSAGESVGAVSRTRAAASAVLRASDDAVAAVCEGYEAARTARARSEEALRRELVDDLLTGTSEVGQLLERAGAFGLRLEAPHIVLVVAGNRRFLDGRALTRAAETILREHSLTDPLVATRDGLLVCVVPEQGDLARGPEPPARDVAPAGRRPGCRQGQGGREPPARSAAGGRIDCHGRGLLPAARVRTRAGGHGRDVRADPPAAHRARPALAGGGQPPAAASPESGSASRRRVAPRTSPAGWGWRVPSCTPTTCSSTRFCYATGRRWRSWSRRCSRRCRPPGAAPARCWKPWTPTSPPAGWRSPRRAGCTCPCGR